MNKYFSLFFLYLGTVIALPLYSQSIYDVTQFGAQTDTTINSAKSIQSAIDNAHENGGGMVYFPPGHYMSGTIVLKSNVRLYFEAGATLFASQNEADYKNDFIVYKKDDSGKAAGEGTPVLIYAKDAQNISIEGKGAIHGRAQRTYEDIKQVDGFIADITENARKSGIEMKMYYKVKPYTCMIFLESCEGIRIRDISLIESTDWTLHFKWSKRIFVEGIYLESSLDKGVNADGIDVDGCKDVVISNCIITTGDDAIVLKSTITDGKYESCENVTVTNCTLVSTSTALKLGTESYGDFRHITFNNCTIRNTNRGLSVVVRDGATVDQLLFSNITLETDRKHFNWWGNGDPIWLVVKKRYPDSKIGSIQNITFQNISGMGQGTSKIEGFPGMKQIKNIRMDNVHLSMQAEDFADKRADHILAFSDVEQITISNSSFRWNTLAGVEKKWESVVALDQVENIAIKNVVLNALPNPTYPIIKCHQVGHALFDGLLIEKPAKILFSISGKNTQDINISRIDSFGEINELLKVEKGAKKEAVKLSSN
ncbi:MAG: glycosyl hydrolase family 28 protein [Bacteroidota bacterium]